MNVLLQNDVDISCFWLFSRFAKNGLQYFFHCVQGIIAKAGSPLL